MAGDKRNRVAQPLPYKCVLHPPGWDVDEPIFKLDGLRPEIATAILMQHVLARHFWGQITIRGHKISTFAKQHNISNRDLYYFFNGHRLVRFATIATLFATLPEDAWPDMKQVVKKVRHLHNRSRDMLKHMEVMEKRRKEMG